MRHAIRKARKGSLILCWVLIGCGGGGGGDGDTGSPLGSGTTPPPPAQPIILSSGQAANAVIGQADFDGRLMNQGGLQPDANTIGYPEGNPVIIDGVLYVSDQANFRLLGYTPLPSGTNENADFVLGAPDFTTVGGGTTADSFDEPQGLAAADGSLLLADYDNNRVLIWNSAPISGNPTPPADVAVGQPDKVSRGGVPCSQQTLNFPSAVAVGGNKLVVADSANHRIMVWNSIPATDGTAADLVLGQSAFDLCALNDVNQDGFWDFMTEPDPTSETLHWPRGVWTDGVRLVVADRSNNRVLIWNRFPTQNFQSADIVLGQVGFTASACNDQDGDGVTDSPSERTLCSPNAVHSNGAQLAVADSTNNRVLLWNDFPSENFQAADVVIGQSDFTSNATAAGATGLTRPQGVFIGDAQLVVGDNQNSRYLIYDSQ
jgi:hypothetical protein